MYSGSAAPAFHSWGKRRSARLRTSPASAVRLERLSAGAGTKGPRLHDWCYLELADLEVEEFSSANQGSWTRGLLIRRHTSLMAISLSSPPGVQRQHPSKRWWRSKAVAGLSRTVLRPRKRVRTRSQREQILAWVASPRFPGDVIAFAMMAAIRHRANPPPPKTYRRTTANTKAPPRRHWIRWSIQEVRRIAIRLARKRIQPAHVIAWSLWRRAHQAVAQRAHFKAKRQL